MSFKPMSDTFDLRIESEIIRNHIHQLELAQLADPCNIAITENGY